MNHTLVKRIVGSAFVVLVITFVVAGLQFYGVISMALGRICFFFAWWIGVAGIVFSEWLWQRRRRDKIAVGLSAALILGLCLFRLDGWAKAHGPTKTVATEGDDRKQEKGGEAANPPQLPSAQSIRKVQKPAPEVELVFKASPLFTPLRKAEIEHEVGAYCHYLTSVGFDMPKQFPPVGTRPGKVNSFLSVSPGTIYSEELTLPADNLDDPQRVRAAFSSYIFGKMFVPNASAGSGFLMSSALVFSNYYLADFSNLRPSAPRMDAPSDRWVSAIWDIRERHGREFANKSLFYTFKQWQVPVEQIQGESFDTYFGLRFTIGMDVEDNMGQHAVSIAQIFKSRGIGLGQVAHP